MKIGVVVACLATAAGMQIDVPLPIGHDLVGMRESLRSMVGTKITDETKNLLADLVQNISSEVEADVVREHDEAETLIEQKRVHVEECDTVRNNAGEKEGLIAAATQASREAHSNCRAEENGVCLSKESNISDFKALVRVMMNNMVDRSHDHRCEQDDGLYASHKPGYNVSIETSAVATFMRNEVSFHTTYYADYVDKSAACKAVTGTWKAKALECDQKQSAFEADFCEWRNNATEMCDTYRQCRQSTEGAYDTTVVNNAALQANLENQWRALKLLECYAQMIRDESTDFTVCDLATDVSQLNISYAPYPPALNCDLTDVVHGPCAATWMSQYYDPITAANDKVTLRVCNACGAWDGDETA